MKNIKDYIEEELFATPANTMGIGGVTDVSGDIPCPTCQMKKRRRKKKAKKETQK